MVVCRNIIRTIAVILTIIWFFIVVKIGIASIIVSKIQVSIAFFVGGILTFGVGVLGILFLCWLFGGLPYLDKLMDDDL